MGVVGAEPIGASHPVVITSQDRVVVDISFLDSRVLLGEPQGADASRQAFIIRVNRGRFLACLVGVDAVRVELLGGTWR